MIWGYHLLLNCSNCINYQINSKEVIEQFIKDLVQRIGMVAHGEPQIEFLLPGTDNEGYSVLQMITTSNITAHFVSRTNVAFIDVFSCKQFDQEIVKELVRDYFDPEIIKATFIERSAQ